MGDRSAPSFAALVQRFFVVHLGQHRAVSPQTIAAIAIRSGYSWHLQRRQSVRLQVQSRSPT